MPSINMIDRTGNFPKDERKNFKLREHFAIFILGYYHSYVNRYEVFNYRLQTFLDITENFIYRKYENKD